MKHKIYFAVFVTSLFLLTIMNPVVSAGVVEEERIIHIESDNVLDYTSKLNIINGSRDSSNYNENYIDNSNYTNFGKLVTPFMENTSIYGGFSGSFLPPAQFILDSPSPRATDNTNLVLTSFVEFQRKNLLSGASVSWWRSPYFYNQSVPASKNWDVTLSIYHVDMPRNVNLSFSGVGNSPVLPTEDAHPSLIFQRSYTNAGNVQDDKQWAIDNSFVMPVNDTLTDPELPYNQTSNPLKYNTYMNYSHTWFNVTAPIYPNESYMVVWDIDSVAVGGYEEAGSFWITASDIGGNNYGRTLVSWNNQTINEFPIDLDSSVVFQVGMGAGITGTKLLYDDPEYTDLTSNLDNENFEDSSIFLRRTFDSSFISEGWTSYSTDIVDAYVIRDSITESVKFHVVESDTSVYDSDRAGIGHSNSLHSQGEMIKLDVAMYGLEYFVDGVFLSSFNDGILVSSVLDIYTETGTEEHSNIIIHKLKKTSEGGGVIYDNFIEYRNSGGTYSIFPIGDSTTDMPENFYLTIENDIDLTIVSMYNKLDPREPFFIHAFNTNSVASFGAFTMDISSYFSRHGNVLSDDDTGINFAGNPDPTFSETLIAEVFNIAMIERTNNLGWTITGGASTSGVSKVDFYEGYETVPPEYNEITSSKAFSFVSTSTSINTKEITQSHVIATSGETIFFNGFYRLVQDNTIQNYVPSLAPYIDDSYIEFEIEGSGGASGVVTDIVQGRAWDSSWHQISPSITGSFNLITVKIRVYFQATGSIFFPNYRQAFADNVDLESIVLLGKNRHVFRQQVDTSDWNATNYYSLMLPFKHVVDPDYAPIVVLQFQNSVDTTLTTIMSKPTDFYQDFILLSIKTSTINPSSVKVRIDLTNFGTDSYLFLQDRNSDFFLNDRETYEYNWFYRVDGASFVDEMFFSPHYSMSTTEGEWSNADSVFTTTFFYFVIVRFVEFNDNDVEIISIKFDEVEVQDFEVFRFNLKSFGEVYTAEEWLSYLEFKNRPTFLDKVVDALATFMQWLLENTLIGRILMAIGKFIYDAIVFLAPYLQALGNLILESFVFLVSIMIYFTATWIMWNFTKFWILVGQDRTEEGLIELTKFTSKVTSVAKSGVGGVGSLVTGVKGKL